MEKKRTSKAFMKGLREIKVKDAAEVRESIREILGVSTLQSLRNYANGRTVNLDVDKARQIEALFASYGVNDCWGE